MRTQTNKKVHKIKRDPFKTLLRFAGILAAVVAVGIGVFLLCNMAIDNDYKNTSARIESENITGRDEFDARMDVLRGQQGQEEQPSAGVIDTSTLPYWERELDGSTWRVQDEGTTILENTSTITMSRAELINGGLLLVNAWHSLPADFSEDGLVSIGQASGFSIQVQDNSVQLFQPAYEALTELLNAAKDDGLEYFIAMEGYRSISEQEVLFSEQMQELSGRYSGDRLIAETKKNVNYPGTSDYHTGMTVRMDVYQRGNSELNNQKFQAESAQGKWMAENCWRYGFVFRFPTKDFPNSSWEDKSHKTGVSAKLNMYRYVGKAHSAAMRVMDLCLEEYVEFLMDHPHVCIYQDGALIYEIVRLDGAGDNQTLSLPVTNPSNSYQASFDNMGGVVMAYSYK